MLLDVPSPGAHRSAVQPSLLIIPGSDRQLTERAERLVSNGIETVEALASALRGAYPRIKVRERSLSHEAVTVWYVYREGSWIPSETS
jgi:hypothetical protein